MVTWPSPLHHHGGLCAEDGDHQVFDLAGGHADGIQDAKDDHSLLRILQVVHAPLEFEQPVQRIVDAQRQRQEDQPEVIAQLDGGRFLAQVDRYRPTHVQSFHRLCARLGVTAQRAGHGREQHIVDGGAGSPADRFDFGQGDGL